MEKQKCGVWGGLIGDKPADRLWTLAKGCRWFSMGLFPDFKRSLAVMEKKECG